MKICRTLIILSTFLVFISCQKQTKSKEELIDRYSKLTSPNNDWEKISTKSATYIVKTVINDKVVNEESKEISQKKPDLQKVVSLKNDTIDNITLTNRAGRNLIKFKDGKFFGINSIPIEKIEFSPIQQLKQYIDDYTLIDSIWREKPSFFLKSETKRDTYIFDKETILLVAYLSESNYGNSLTSYENYIETDGFILPFRKTVSIEEANYAQVYDFDKVRFNSQFPKGHFQFQEEWQSLTKGSKAPIFSLPKVFDETIIINNSVLEGKITLLDFWATWCKPCLKEFPSIDKQYKKYRDNGFQVISVSIDNNIDSPKSYLEKNPFSWNLSLFSSGGFDSELAKNYQLVALPKAILIDRQGKIIAMDADLRGNKLESILEKIFLNE